MPKIKAVSLDDVIQQAEDLLSKMTNRQASEAVRAALSRLQDGESSLTDELKTYGKHLGKSSRQFFTATKSTDGLSSALSDAAHSGVDFVRENKPLWGLDEWKAFVEELRNNAKRFSEETNAYIDGVIEPVKGFYLAVDSDEAAAETEDAPQAESSAPAKAAKAPAASKASADDDLTAITGVGPALQKKLKDHGISSYAQIAALNADEIAHLEAEIIKFPGRIERDDWVGQAKQLMAQGY